VHRHELTDAQWEKVKDLLPVQPGPRSRLGDRAFVNAVVWRLKTGAPWRDIPDRYGSWKTTYNRFARWAKRGVWEHVFKALCIDDEVGSLIDGTVVRAHQDAAGGKGGSDAIIWAVLEEVFPRKSTRSPRRRASPSTSSSPPASNTTRRKRSA
jgi:transposase